MSQPPITPFPKHSKQLSPSSVKHSASQLNSCRQAPLTLPNPAHITAPLTLPNPALITAPLILPKPALISNRTVDIDHVEDTEHFENEGNDADCIPTNFLTHANSMTNPEFTPCPENIKLLIELNKSQTELTKSQTEDTKFQKELIIEKLKLQLAETEDRRVINQERREAMELLDKTIGVQCATELSGKYKRNLYLENCTIKETKNNVQVGHITINR